MKTFTGFALVLLVFMLLGCEPENQTPGLWLSATYVETFPDNWSFSNNFQEIAIEVGTPYFIPHSTDQSCFRIASEHGRHLIRLALVTQRIRSNSGVDDLYA